MSAKRRIEAAIFDMDGLLIDSEPLWDQAEVEVMESLGVGTRRRDELPDLLGLRIDLVVDLWYAQFQHIEHFLQHHQRRGRGQAHL